MKAYTIYEITEFGGERPTYDYFFNFDKAVEKALDYINTENEYRPYCPDEGELVYPCGWDNENTVYDISTADGKKCDELLKRIIYLDEEIDRKPTAEELIELDEKYDELHRIIRSHGYAPTTREAVIALFNGGYANLDDLAYYGVKEIEIK